MPEDETQTKSTEQMNAGMSQTILSRVVVSFPWLKQQREMKTLPQKVPPRLGILREFKPITCLSEQTIQTTSTSVHFPEENPWNS